MTCRSLSGAAVLSALLALGGVSQTVANEMDDRPPADFLLEMIDPSLCMVPPGEISDAELIAMMEDGWPDIDGPAPVSGTWQHDGEWQAEGQGNFNTSRNGLVASVELVLRDADDRLRFLCLALVRHVDTQMTEGDADLAGPEVESLEGDTFMVVALVGGRDGDAFAPQDELLTDSGSLSLARVDDGTMSGSLSLSGRLDGEASGDAVSLVLELSELWHFDGMRVVDWDHDLPGESEAASSSANAGESAELRELFLGDLATEFTPLLSADASEILQHTLYRYDYTPFASSSGDTTGGSSREGVFYREDDRLRPFTRPNTSLEMPFFDGLIAPGFHLNEDSAEAFREFLMTITGERFFDAVDTDAIVHREGEWGFLTGTFFDDYKAFVVSVDEQGRVEGVAYELRYLPQ